MSACLHADCECRHCRASHDYLFRMERSIDRRPDAAIQAARERDELARIRWGQEKRNEA